MIGFLERSNVFHFELMILFGLNIFYRYILFFDAVSPEMASSSFAKMMFFFEKYISDL